LIILSKKDIERIYMKTKSAFANWFNNDENKFLESEINLSLDSILFKEVSINISYFSDSIYDYLIESKVILLSPKLIEIGTYTYIEDGNGIPIDDILVFH